MTLHLSVTGNENDDRLDKIAVYFNEASGYNTYVPRSVNIDLVGIIIRVTKVLLVKNSKEFVMLDLFKSRIYSKAKSHIVYMVV